MLSDKECQALEGTVQGSLLPALDSCCDSAPLTFSRFFTLTSPPHLFWQPEISGGVGDAERQGTRGSPGGGEMPRHGGGGLR